MRTPRIRRGRATLDYQVTDPRTGTGLTLSAAAQILSSPKIKREGTRAQKSGSSLAWQSEAWDFYDLIGELWFGVNWLGNATSRAVLVAAKCPPGSVEPVRVEDGIPAELVADFAGGNAGQAQFLQRAAIHLTVTGDSYFVGRTVTDDDGAEAETPAPGATGPRRGLPPVGPLAGRVVDGAPGEAAPEVEWCAYSTDEVMYDSGTWQINDGAETFPIGEHDIIMRCWRPHPRRHHEAQSPVRAALPVLRELHGLTKHVGAQIDSRLAGAGILFLPQSMTFPTGQGGQGGDATEGEDAFIRDLIDAMLTPIKDRDSAAAVVPLVVKVPDDAIGKVQHVTFATPLDERAKDLRDEALRRFALGMDIPPEVVLGLGDSNHWCTLPHVRIMTKRGWRTYQEIEPTDEALTLNHETGLSEWQPILAVNTFEVKDHPMVRIKTRRHESTTTAGHRWPLISGQWGKHARTWATSGELLEAARARGEGADLFRRLVLAAPNADLPTEPKYSDALVEAVAWYFTEGDAGKREGRRTPRVTITQSRKVNPENVERITRALTALFGPPSEQLDKGGRYASPESVARRARARAIKAANPSATGAQIAAELGVSSTMVYKYLANDARTRDDVPRWRIIEDTGRGLARFRLNAAAAEIILEHAPDRVVSLDFIRSLTAAQLELFMDTAIRGDGHMMGGTTPVFGQKDPRRCDAFELAAILSGRSPRRSLHRGIGASKDGPREKTQHVVTVSDKTTSSPKGRNVTETTYTGTVWCPTTPNGTWLAEEDGHVFYTGNSAWQVDESSIKLHVEPLLATICLALTVGWFRPALEAAGVPDAADYLVWYDVEALKQRPNRAAEALDLFDRFIINSATVRREVGFDETDAPDRVELARMILLSIAKQGVNIGPLLTALGVPADVVDQITAHVDATTGGQDAGAGEPADSGRTLPTPPTDPPGGAP